MFPSFDSWSQRTRVPALAILLATAPITLAHCTVARDDARDGAQALGAAPAPLPAGFQLGTAIAGFQVDMGCPTIPAASCEDRRSDWYQWITTSRIENNPVLYSSKEPPSAGPGFFERYEDDLDRASQDLHGDALRLSIEWSRIFPTATFGIDGFDALHAAASADGLAYYHRIFAAMRARGLAPLVTVNHYTLPLWIHDGNDCNIDFDHCTKKGWADPATIVPEIAKYAGFVAREFGGEVDQWATLNEPFSAVALAGYLFPSADRVNPPGLYLHAGAAKLATRAMIEAHARMYDAIKEADVVDADGDGRAAQVGLVYAIAVVDPLTGNARDAKAAENMRYLFDDLFLNGVAKGLLDEDWTGHPVARPDLANRLDYLGVNYYTRVKAQGNLIPIPGAGLVTPLLTFNPLGARAANDPAGLYDAVKYAAKFGVPLIVTETGIDQAKDASAGAKWIVRSLASLQRAMAEGVDVRGYFVWSLTDNYEWNHGTAMKFGLYAVDPKDTAKTRTPRDAARVFGEIGAARAIPPAIAAAFGAP